MAKNTFIARVNKARKDYEKSMKGAKKEITAALADLLPEGFLLEWTQGTPSFNDGDPCRFRVESVYIGTFHEQVEDSKYDPDDPSDECPEGHDSRVAIEAGTRIPDLEDPDATQRGNLTDYTDDGSDGVAEVEYSEDGCLAWCGLSATAMRKIRAAWRKLPSDVLEAAFGNGARVRVFWDGTSDNDEYYCE